MNYYKGTKIYHMSTYTSSSQFLIVNQNDAKLFNEEKFINENINNFAQSNALFQTAAFLNNNFYIGITYDNSAYIYRYNFEGNLTN